MSYRPKHTQAMLQHLRMSAAKPVYIVKRSTISDDELQRLSRCMPHDIIPMHQIPEIRALPIPVISWRRRRAWPSQPGMKRR